ncbi:SIS domain-containing protein [Thermodesulfobacteriota bacterium]
MEILLARTKKHLTENLEVKRTIINEGMYIIVQAAALLADSFKSGNKMLLCGNGGSAADCQHMATEFVSRLSADFERDGLPAIALTTDTSYLTAYANDYGFDGVFERQVLTLGSPGDVLLGISTSGNSANILKAIEAAKKKQMRTIALIGKSGVMANICDIVITVPSQNTQHIQEAHLVIEHIICDLVEQIIFNKV